VPNNIKFTLSVIVLVVGAIIFYVEWRVDGGAAGWVILGLAPFMVLAMWLFPETKKKEGDGR
jgi:hypothetical protein